MRIVLLLCVLMLIAACRKIYVDSIPVPKNEASAAVSALIEHLKEPKRRESFVIDFDTSAVPEYFKSRIQSIARADSSDVSDSNEYPRRVKYIDGKPSVVRADVRIPINMRESVGVLETIALLKAVENVHDVRLW